MKKIYANNLTTLSLGRQGENLARQVIFDLSAWEAEYGPGVAELIHQRSGDAQPYPLAVQRDGTLVTWDVTATDTEMDSYGKCELRYYAGETLAKSQIWRTWVESAMDTPSETAPPEPEQGWVDQVLAAGVFVKEATDSAKTYSNSAEQSASGAAQSAQEAAGSASAASTSATNAKASEESAAESASAAANSAASASAAASAASGSAAAAAASETAAKASEKAAKSSEIAAKASETAAAESASAAQQSATSAAESAAVYDTVVADVNQLKADLAAVTPDDTAVNGKPWTSKKIVDSICRPFEETGNPVQCYPVENYPLGLKVRIEPKQDGEGDPSPENVRPITGTVAVQIVHSNDAVEANTCDIALPETVYGGTLDVETGVLTVEWVYYSNVLGDTSKLETAGDGFVRRNLKGDVNTMLGANNQKCNVAPYKYDFNGGYTHFYMDSNGYAMIILPVDTPADTVIQTIHKTKKPATIQLTPQQITALSGTNTLYTDAGTLTVTGAEDPKHTITELKNAIISLGGNV